MGLLGAATGYLASSGYRDANRAKSNRSGISNQNYCCRAQWLHTKGHDHGRGNGHRGAEASEGLQQTAKTEGNEDSLNANIAITQKVKGLAQILEAPGSYGDFIEPNCRNDDPDDGQESE